MSIPARSFGLSPATSWPKIVSVLYFAGMSRLLRHLDAIEARGNRVRRIAGLVRRGGDRASARGVRRPFARLHVRAKELLRLEDHRGVGQGLAAVHNLAPHRHAAELRVQPCLDAGVDLLGGDLAAPLALSNVPADTSEGTLSSLSPYCSTAFCPAAESNFGG